VVVASIAVAVALALLSSTLASAFHEELLTRSFQIIALAVPARAIGLLLRARLRTSEDVRLAVGLEQVAVPGTNLIVVLAFLAVGTSNWLYAPVLGQTVGQIIATVITAFAVMRSRDRSVARSASTLQWLSYGIPMWFEAFVVMLLAYADQLMLGRLTSVEKVGIYAPAARLAALVGIPLIALSVVLEPMMARLDGAGAREKLERLYVRVNWGTAAVGLASGAVLVMIGRPLLALFGPEYTKAFAAFAILVAGQVVSMITGSSGTLLTMVGWSKLALVNASFALALNVGLGLVLIPRYGFVGAAIGTSSALATIGVLQLLQVRTLVRVRSFDREGWRFWAGWAHRVAGRYARQ
jgi:O-antigen/teichoic acid export membrane protein